MAILIGLICSQKQDVDLRQVHLLDKQKLEILLIYTPTTFKTVQK